MNSPLFFPLWLLRCYIFIKWSISYSYFHSVIYTLWHCSLLWRSSIHCRSRILNFFVFFLQFLWMSSPHVIPLQAVAKLFLLKQICFSLLFFGKYSACSSLPILLLFTLLQTKVHLKKIYLSIIYLSIYYLRERESGRENLKQAPYSAWSSMWGYIPQPCCDHDLSWNQESDAHPAESPRSLVKST